MKRQGLYFLLFFALTAFSNKVNAQPDSQRPLIQFSGVVISGDSLQPLPFSNVIIHHANRGTQTDFYGFFSFVAMKGDTIDFHSFGYKTASFIIPDSLIESRYSLIQTLLRDTIMLKETVIYPWPSKDEFKRAFLELQLPDDDMKRAQRNIELAQRKEVRDNVMDDGSLSYKLAMQQQQSRLYSAGQYPVNNLLNPLAWAAFIKAWQDGAFKRKDD